MSEHTVTADALPARPTTVSASGRRLLLAGSVGSALSNFGILFLAARALDVQQNKEFLVFWALLFGLFGVQSGIQNETTRSTTSSSPRGARVMTVALAWGAVFAVVVAAAATLGGRHLLPTSVTAAGAILAVTALVYPLYITLLGALGGSRQWEWFGSTILVEVGLRVSFVVIAAAIGTGLAGFEAASAAAVLALVVVLVVGRAPREMLGCRADVGFCSLLRHDTLAMASTACTALLVTGYPALVSLTTPERSLGLPPQEAAALMGGCMLAVSLTRAPIMMPLTAFVGVAISAFTGHRGSVWAAVRRPFLLLLLVGLVGAAAAWPIGPWFLRAFKPEYDLPGWYFAALTASSVLMAWLTILGAVALATSRHLVYVAGWGLATATAAACLLLPLSLLFTTTLSVSIGPLLGCLLIFALLRSRSGPPMPRC